MDLLFGLDEVDAFVRQPDGSLFSWCERFRCYHHLIYGIVSDFSHVAQSHKVFSPPTCSINYTIHFNVLIRAIYLPKF